MIQGKFDGDDLDDLIVANGTDGSISFLKGLGNTDYFAPPGPAIEVGQSPTAFAAADLNHDGKPIWWSPTKAATARPAR